MKVIDRLERARVNFAEAKRELEAAREELGSEDNPHINTGLYHATDGEKTLRGVVDLADMSVAEDLPKPSAPPLHPVA